MDSIKFNPARYEVFYQKLDQILAEGMNTVRYLSASVISREAGEALSAFYLPTGEAVDIASGILMHFLNVTRVIKYMRENRYHDKGIGIYDGDQFVNSDAFIGGMHLPDTSVVAPFFYKGELLGWVAAITHTTEVGGIEPGGVCPSATEAWHDGIHLPAVKIIERGHVKRDVMNMILRSVRTPRPMELDLKARVAGNVKVRDRLVEVVEDFGVDFFKQASKQIVKDSATYARAMIKRLRPGIYRGRSYCDTVGPGRDRIAALQMDMEVTEEGELYLRMPIVSPQQASFNNCYEPAIEATAGYTLLTQLFWGGRWSSGILEPVHLELAPHSRMCADASYPVGYCTVGIGFGYCAALTEALSRAFYASGLEEEVQAPGAYGFNGLIFSGLDQFGRPFGGYSVRAAITVGGGGRMGKDGIDSNYHFYNPFQYVADVEGEEAIMPLAHLRMNHNPNAMGYGKWRSGVPAATVTMIHGSGVVFANSMGIGGKMPGNQGLFGGYSGPCTYADQVLNSDMYERIRTVKRLPVGFEDTEDISKIVLGDYKRYSPSINNKSMKPGDLIVMHTTTGGGIGDPIERDLELIVEDIWEMKATYEHACKVYCISINQKTLKVDLVKTEKLRDDKRKERLRHGVPAREYIRQIVKKREERDLSQPVLDFLDEQTGFCPLFIKQLEKEAVFLEDEKDSLEGFTISRRLFKLTPYVDVAEDRDGRRVCVCSKCGHVYCEAGDDFKYFSLIYDRSPDEVYPEHIAGDKDWYILREFYCPGCGLQVEVETTPPGTPILRSYEALDMGWTIPNNEGG